MDWWGGRADPFVRLWVREESRFRTSVRSRTLSPLWDEQFTLIVHSTRFQSLTLVLYDSDTLLADEEMGRAEVPLHSIDLSPGATNDLWLPIVPPHKQHRRGWKGRRAAAGLHSLGLRRGGSSSSSSSSSSLQGGSGAAGTAAVGGIAGSSTRAGVPDAGPAGLDDTARGGSLLGHGVRGRQAPGGQPPSPQLQRRSLALRRLTAAVPTALANLGGGAGSKECRLHVQCSFSAFTPQEVEAAMCAGRPGIVTIMRRLSRQSKVPSLLRSGVLGIHLERAEGLVSKTAAGFTRNYKVCIGVGPHIRRVTERGKVDFMHKRNPVFDESLELLVDGETASAEDTEVTLEIWSSHFLRKDKFKGRAVVPLREVQRRRRLRGSWPLQEVPAPGGGTLLMELSWTAAAGMY